MKKKKKLIHRIGALLCALVVAVSAFGVSVPYKASTSGSVASYLQSIGLYELVASETKCSFSDEYGYAVGFYYYEYDTGNISSQYIVKIVEFLGSPSFYYISNSSDCGVANNSYGGANTYSIYFNTSSSGVCTYSVNSSYESSSSYYWLTGVGLGCELLDIPIYYNDYDVMTKKGGSEIALASTSWAKMVFNVDIANGTFTYEDIDEPSYNSNLGYLQNVKRTRTYERGALYNYDEDSMTYHFYHDLESTTGVDLTSGNYVVRHYIANAIVKGYEKEDIVEMSEQVLGGEYDASQGYFSYLNKDYEDKMLASGFEYPNFLDTLFGQFVLQHHYLQIVNLDTNESGGYLHLYPKDETGEFGVELVYEGLDNNFEVDNTLEGGVVLESEGSGLTHEEALENAEEKEKNSIDLSGVYELTGVLKSYASQIGNVTSGIGVLLSNLPPFMVVGLGIGVCLLVLVIIVKVIRG